jgi:hypothetical protein
LRAVLRYLGIVYFYFWDDAAAAVKFVRSDSIPYHNTGLKVLVTDEVVRLPFDPTYEIGADHEDGNAALVVSVLGVCSASESDMASGKCKEPEFGNAYALSAH